MSYADVTFPPSLTALNIDIICELPPLPPLSRLSMISDIKAFPPSLTYLELHTFDNMPPLPPSLTHLIISGGEKPPPLPLPSAYPPVPSSRFCVFPSIALFFIYREIRKSPPSPP